MEAGLWDTRIGELEGGRVHRVRVLRHGEPVSFAEVVEGWRLDGAFRAFFNRTLAEAPYHAYLWETPPVTTHRSCRSFEFVLVDSPQLARLGPEPDTFASYFEATGPGEAATVFPNLGGDAVLIAPTPQASPDAYAHLAAFVRSAPAEQRDEFWRIVGETIGGRLGDRPLWLSTNGLGVAWLHVRLDIRPKYYTFEPYRASD